jgi:hypothetical protein
MSKRLATRLDSFLHRAPTVRVAMFVLALPMAAQADDDRIEKRSVEGARQAPATTVLPLTRAPWGDEREGQVSAVGFYDGARRRALSELNADVRVFGPLSVRGGAQTVVAQHLVGPIFGGQLHALSQSRHLVDAAFSASYRSEGFNLVRAIEMQAMFGRRFGDSAVYLNVAYGHGLERNERYADLRLSALQRLLNERLFVGVDSRLRLDAELDDDEPAREPALDLIAGPVAGLTAYGVALSSFGGVSAVRYRDGSPDRLGVFGGLSMGTAWY